MRLIAPALRFSSSAFAALIFGLSAVTAQTMTCPAVVQTAVASTAQACQSLRRNQACYGYPVITADKQTGVSIFAFSSVGNIVDVAAIQTLTLSRLDTTTPSWGLARMKIQADLPNETPDQNATLLAFGDVQIQNRVSFTGNLTTLTVTAKGALNVRSGPSPSTPIIGVMADGDSATVNGRSADGNWLRILRPGDPESYGWIFANLVQGTGEINRLSTVDPDALPYNPMQAFNLRSGRDDSPCPEAPDSGLLIQSPDGTPITISINQTNVQVNGTAYVQAADALTIQMIEGSALVSAFDVSQLVPAGTRIVVPMGEDGTAAGAPGEPEAYDRARLETLPLSLLDRELVIAPPLKPQAGDCIVTALREGNLRTGPGTEYTVFNTLIAGQSKIADGYALDTTRTRWWRLVDKSWVRDDLVRFTDNCTALPEVQSPPPTPPPVEAQSQNITTFFFVNGCQFVGVSAEEGDTIQLLFGAGSWRTSGEARTALFGLEGSMSLDGAPISSFLGVVKWGENDYGVAVKSNWKAEPGTYILSANLSILGGLTQTCTLAVP